MRFMHSHYRDDTHQSPSSLEHIRSLVNRTILFYDAWIQVEKLIIFTYYQLSP